jgi:hypothetical protein
MRLTLPCAALLAMASCWGAQAAETSSSGDPVARYQDLLAKAMADPVQADWTVLRYAYAATPQFNVFGHPGVKHEMFRALGAKDYAAALKTAEAIIDDDFVDIDAHDVAAQAERALGQTAKSRSDRDIAHRLAASVKTGDGLSPYSPYNVITVDEEYSVLRLANLKVVNMQIGHAGPHHFDVVTAADAKGVEHDYFFLTDAVWAAEATANPDAVPQPNQVDRAR